VRPDREQVTEHLGSTGESGEPNPDGTRRRETRCREKTEPRRGKMTETRDSRAIYTRLTRIAELARKHRGEALKTLSHHIDVEFLTEAFHQTRKDGATGIDHQTAEEYGKDLEKNLESLKERFKSRTYWAPPVRRSYIPKADGTKRPLGIPTFEDKVLQVGVAMVLKAIYEEDFLDCSHAYRPKRSAHGALQQFRDGLMEMGGGWVYEVDIKAFFDTLDHKHLRSFLDQRVKDGPIRWTIDKWLAAGVMEEGTVRSTDEGTPQGGVISPLLANLYLHEVLDTWFERDVKPRMKGRVLLVRYADDFVMGFEREEDARKVAEVTPKRFAKYGLSVHPTKTRLLYFGRPAKFATTETRKMPKPETFDFLAFTHYWGRSEKQNWVIKQKTARSRLRRAIESVRQWCKKHRHRELKEQWRRLNAKLKGYYNYFGVSGNIRAVSAYAREVRKAWYAALSRRSQRGMTWEDFNRLLKSYPLPAPVLARSVNRRSANPYPKSRMR
jgi:RNA-directed DNA polymerase